LFRKPDWVTLQPQDICLQLAPASFDASILEFWGPLTTGGRLAIYPPGPVSPDLFAATIRAEGVTVLWLTTSLFHQMVIEHAEAFRGVRHLLVGGEVVSPQRVAQLFTACPGILFSNCYGPTENTLFTTCWCTDAKGFAPDGPVPIGRPIRGTDIAILDPAGQPVPPGVVGELYAAGAGLARGYLNRPAATEERFGDGPGGRSYRTGDLARWRPDGTVDFCGRADRQVKVQGYRIEPGEIEEALRRQPGIRQAVVVTQPDGAGGNRLLGYVVPAGEAVNMASLTGALRRELPAYMIPRAIQALPELPLNRNGKLDRSALPVIRRMPRTLPSPYVAPAKGTESRLASLWGELLSVEPVGATDDFFDLGGHSLLAAALVRRLRTDFAADLPMELVHLCPTVATLAVALTSQGGEVTSETMSRSPLTDGERAFVDRVGQHYADDGFPLDSGRVLGWMIIADAPEQSATDIGERLRVSRSTVDAVAEQLVPATLFSRREGEDGEYFLSLRDDAWPRVVSHTFAGWTSLHKILQDGVAALEGEPPERSARVASMESLFAYLVTELPDMMRRWQEQEASRSAS
jgi:hypothetical protein